MVFPREVWNTLPSKSSTSSSSARGRLISAFGTSFNSGVSQSYTPCQRHSLTHSFLPHSIPSVPALYVSWPRYSSSAKSPPAQNVSSHSMVYKPQSEQYPPLNITLLHHVPNNSSAHSISIISTYPNATYALWWWWPFCRLGGGCVGLRGLLLFSPWGLLGLALVIEWREKKV